MKDDDPGPTAPARRHRILRAAERLFIHYGPAKTTMGDIARSVGVGVGSLYLDFTSKDEIVSELAAEKSRFVAARMRDAAGSAAPGPERLAAALAGRVIALLDLASGGEHACDLMRCSKSRDFSLGEEPRAVVRELIEEGKAKGELSVDDPEQVIDTVELAFGCLSPPFVYRMERPIAEEKARHLAQVIARGLAASR
ncbi:MAG: TetR/AcrR family transcriptional regulator [Polyangiaceae bacterium]|nr:TetR/AcrR family transcriptional regulator [Polyangiaceae bacterium]